MNCKTDNDHFDNLKIAEKISYEITRGFFYDPMKFNIVTKNTLQISKILVEVNKIQRVFIWFLFVRHASHFALYSFSRSLCTHFPLSYIAQILVVLCLVQSGHTLNFSTLS